MRTTAGSEFHFLGAGTENVHLPINVLVLGIKRAEVQDDEICTCQYTNVHSSYTPFNSLLILARIEGEL